MKIKINDQTQLNLTLPCPITTRRTQTARRRVHRAGAWFNYMRQIVDEAPDWGTDEKQLAVRH
jgi:hypothetical protein